MPPTTACWAVHWPANTDEPIWLFDSELTAKAFARRILSHTTVSRQLVRSSDEARALLDATRPCPICA